VLKILIVLAITGMIVIYLERDLKSSPEVQKVMKKIPNEAEEIFKRERVSNFLNIVWKVALGVMLVDWLFS
jgi:hypothetical protein